MDRWWSWTTADGHERIQNEANRQKHRLGILCWQVWRDSRSVQCSLSLARGCCCYWQRFSTQEGWVKVASRITFGDGSLFFLTLWRPLFIDNNLKTSCRSLMYWLCKYITAAFFWTHDIKLEIRATNKEATTLLYAMFVYNARREDWIQENDESVFENFRIRPSTRIRIRIG